MKRLFDIIFSLLGIMVLSPVLIIVCILIKFDSRGSALYRQTRVGRFGENFAILKFRTMVINADKQGLLITVGKDARVTNIGALLRKTKIDELPQLFNVLFGQMSIVGPRPEVPPYVQLYQVEIRDLVLSVRPGITDYASLQMIDENLILAKSNNAEQTYINEIMPIKLAYAVQYVKHNNLWIDINLILATFVKIFSR